MNWPINEIFRESRGAVVPQFLRAATCDSYAFIFVMKKLKWFISSCIPGKKAFAQSIRTVLYLSKCVNA